MVKETAIKISFKTKARLQKLKREGETFESVILHNLNPLDRRLKALWDSQDKRRKIKFKKKSK